MTDPVPTAARGSRPIVGVIANPVASKDIRRLVGLARVVDVEEKANMIARLLVGMTAGPAVQVLALDDAAGLVRRAVRLTRGANPTVDFLDVSAEGTEADTRRAAQALREAGAALVVTVGGDGTMRSAAEGWPTVPLAPLAAGTNNAVAIADEPTIVGLATARAASGAAEGAMEPLACLSVHVGDAEPSTALVDVVGVRSHWTGARALWEPEDLVEAVVTNVRPTAVGVASIAARLGRLAAGEARHIRFGSGTAMRTVFGPGLVGDVSVADFRSVAPGRRVELDPATQVVALDGERRIVRTANAYVDIAAGPTLLSVARALETKHRGTSGAPREN